MVKTEVVTLNKSTRAMLSLAERITSRFYEGRGIIDEAKLHHLMFICYGLHKNVLPDVYLFEERFTITTLGPMLRSLWPLTETDNLNPYIFTLAESKIDSWEKSDLGSNSAKNDKIITNRIKILDTLFKTTKDMDSMQTLHVIESLKSPHTSYARIKTNFLNKEIDSDIITQLFNFDN